MISSEFAALIAIRRNSTIVTCFIPYHRDSRVTPDLGKKYEGGYKSSSLNKSFTVC
jgi:hypothetical protein